jgi:hypothetical protein
MAYRGKAASRITNNKAGLTENVVFCVIEVIPSSTIPTCTEINILNE